MAIAGFLVHTLTGKLSEVQAELDAMPRMTTYGAHDGQYIVLVAEAPSGELEQLVERVNAIEGVIAVYTTYVTVEDELEEDDEAQELETSRGEA